MTDETSDPGDVARLRATAHPVRLRIMSLLTAEAMSAADVARALELTHANASYHLRVLHDIGELVPLILQGGIFVTPIGYSISGTPPTLKLLLELNPFTGIIEAFRWCLLGAPITEMALAFSLGITALLTVLGWWVFVRLEPSFADVV